MTNEHAPSSPEKETLARLPVLPMTGAVVFPQVLVPMVITDEPITRLVSSVVTNHKKLVLATVRPDRDAAEQDASDPPFYDVATVGQILQHVKMPDATMRLLIQGRERVRLSGFRRDDDGWSADIEPVPSVDEDDERAKALHRVVLGQFQEIAALAPHGSEELRGLLSQIQDAGQLADFIAAHLNLEIDRKQELLAEPSVALRLERLAEILGEEQKALEYGTELQEKIKDEVEKTQREFWLREQLRIIQQELGEEEGSEVDQLRKRIEEAKLPEQARE